MPGRQLIAVLFMVGAMTIGGCDGSRPNVRLTIAPGVSVPSAEKLASKLEGTLHGAPGTKAYVRRDGKLVEVTPSRIAKPLSAVVRSFDAKSGLAYVDLLEHPEYSMPLLQIWRFDGKAWTDSVDPGIFVR